MQNIRHEAAADTEVQLLAPGEVIDMHRHDQPQLLYAARGLHTVTTETAAWFAPHNRAVYVPAGVAHSHRARGPVELHLVGLPPRRTSLPHDRPAVVAVDDLLRELIVHCTRTTSPTSDPTSDAAAARSRVLRVLHDRLEAAPREHLVIPIPTDPRLRDLCGLITVDPASTATLAQLGRRIGVGERTLSRLFHHDLGMTFIQWRTQARLLHALTLLSAGASVSDAAVRSGWSTASTFIGVYRTAFGSTPGQAHREA